MTDTLSMKVVFQVIIAIVICLEVLLFFNIKNYRRHVFLPILFTMLALIVFALAKKVKQYSITGLESDSPPFALMLGLIIAFFVPMGINIYLNSKYQNRLEYLLENNSKIKTIETIGSILLAIQTIMLYFITSNVMEGNSVNFINVFLYIIITVIYGILNTNLLTEVLYFSTDGFTSK